METRVFQPVPATLRRLFDGTRQLIGRMLQRRLTPEPRLRVLEKVAVTPQLLAALLEADGTTYLLACSKEGNPTIRAVRSGSATQHQNARHENARRETATRLGPRSLRW